MLVLDFTLAILLILCYGNFLYNKYPFVIPFIALYIFELFWILVSLIYLEHGTYVSEIGAFSYETGGVFRFILVVVPFCICAPYFYNRRLKYAKINRLKTGVVVPKKIIVAIAALVVVYVTVNVLISGSIFTNPNITKGNFYNTYSVLPLAGELGAAYLKVAMFILGMECFNKEYKKYGCFPYWMLFTFAVFSKIAIGEKFYGIYTLVFYFFLYKLVKIFSAIPKGNTIKIKYILIVIGIFMVAFVCVYQLGYVLSSRLEYLMAFTMTDNAIDALISRTLALQGHTWWGIDHILIESGEVWGSISQLFLEIKAAILNVSVYDSKIGLVRIMYLVAPSNIVDLYIANHVRFYGGYWTVGVFVLGYFGTFLLSVGVAYLFAWIYHTLLVCMLRGSYISASICLLYSLSFYEFFRIGNLSILFGIRGIICLGLILFMTMEQGRRGDRNFEKSKINKEKFSTLFH